MGGRRETVPAAETETAGGVLMKKNELGGLLLRLRKEAGLSQSLLCSGVCSVSRYARIEREELEPDFFLLDRLMGRLGKSVERLEYVMPLSVYRIYERRQDIQEAILHGRLSEAENLLALYEKEKLAEGSLHRQYILQERAQVAWIREEDPDEILKLLDQAIGETLLSEEEMKKERCFSAEEGKLLLFRWEVSRKSRIANRDFEELKQLLRCICEQKTNRMDRSKIFPYAVLLYGEHAPEEKNSTVRSLAEEALELLRDEGKLLYMPEVLELCGKLLRKSGVPKEELRAQLLDRMRQSLLETEQEYGISFEKYRLFDHVIRHFYIDAEMIRKTRNAVGMTQEKLSEDICAQETLARVETGRQTPQSRKLQQMMEKMGRGCGRVNMAMVTEQYETIELKQELSKYIHQEKHENAKKVLEKIKTRLDMNSPVNQQYIQAEQVDIDYAEKTADGKKCIERLRLLYRMTAKSDPEEECEFVLSIEEFRILSQMALIYFGNQQKDKSIFIYRKQVKQFSMTCVKPVFHILEWGVSMDNLALCMTGENGDLEEAISLSIESIKIDIKAGLGASLGRSLITLGDAWEQKRDERYVHYFKNGIFLLKLYKMDYLYHDVISHIQLMKFPDRNQFNDVLRWDGQFLK